MNVITSPSITGAPTATDAFGRSTRRIGNSANSRNVVPMNGRGDGDRSTHFAMGTYVLSAVKFITASNPPAVRAASPSDHPNCCVSSATTYSTAKSRANQSPQRMKISALSSRRSSRGMSRRIVRNGTRGGCAFARIRFISASCRMIASPTSPKASVRLSQ